MSSTEARLIARRWVSKVSAKSGKVGDVDKTNDIASVPLLKIQKASRWNDAEA